MTKVFCFFSSEKKAFLLLVFTVFTNGCVPDRLIYPPGLTPAENYARITGIPMPAPRPLAPTSGTVWPAPPAPTPTMLDMMAQAQPAVAGRPAGGAAARGDFGLCLPTPAHLDTNGRRSTAPPGAALGIC